MQKSNYNIRDLHPGVVNVVLHIHFATGELKQANERVSEDCIAQVADMRGFVGIDARMLDQNLVMGVFGFRFVAGKDCTGESGTPNSRIDVSSACDLKLLE